VDKEKVKKLTQDERRNLMAEKVLLTEELGFQNGKEEIQIWEKGDVRLTKARE